MTETRVELWRTEERRSLALKALPSVRLYRGHGMFHSVSDVNSFQQQKFTDDQCLGPSEACAPSLVWRAAYVSGLEGCLCLWFGGLPLSLVWRAASVSGLEGCHLYGLMGTRNEWLVGWFWFKRYILLGPRAGALTLLQGI